MGNQNTNDDFTRNPNFNINQHQQAMRNLQANYTESGYSLNAGPGNQVKVTET